jgi:hypothetical protein
MVMLRGAVFLVQEINDQTDDAETQAENESRKHGEPPLDIEQLKKYTTELS